MLTRITTRPLPEAHGDEKAALESVYSLFGLTREIVRHHGRECIEFTRIAVIVLNQVVRPFTAKWHRFSAEGAFADKDKTREFRGELALLQEDLRRYTRMLAEIAQVEDLTSLQQ